MPCKELNHKSVVIREVWSENFEAEFELIRTVIDLFPFISMDTEFPGVVYRPSGESGQPTNYYCILKTNVNALKIIQVGLTLSDAYGNLPDLGTTNWFIWEFNFRNFDVGKDLHVSESIQLLREQGIDFEKIREKGIESCRFAELMMSSGLVCNDSVSWVTFHSAYDFGYLLKMLTGRNLPEDIREFLILVKVFFGTRVYDVKHLIRFCGGLYGGLDRIAKALDLHRAVGKSHQAGSDSLLTWQIFQKITDKYFPKDVPDKYAGILYGLEIF